MLFSDGETEPAKADTAVPADSGLPETPVPVDAGTQPGVLFVTSASFKGNLVGEGQDPYARMNAQCTDLAKNALSPTVKGRSFVAYFVPAINGLPEPAIPPSPTPWVLSDGKNYAFEGAINAALTGHDNPPFLNLDENGHEIKETENVPLFIWVGKARSEDDLTCDGWTSASNSRHGLAINKKANRYYDRLGETPNCAAQGHILCVSVP